MRRLAMVVIAVVLVATSCQQAGVNESMERSTTPLLVPTGEWREAFEFTAPPGATDLYQTRWNFSPGSTLSVSGWQIASSTSYDETLMTDGPGQELVDEALRASRGEGCVIGDPDSGIQLCAYEAEFALGGVNAYLVRLEQNQILVINYSNLGGERTTYNADSLEARYLTADFEAIPVDGDTDDHLVYIY